MFKFVSNESIDGMFFRMRWGPIFQHGAVRPVLQSIVQLKGRFFIYYLDLPSWSRVGRAEFNPAADIGDGGFREPPGRWHPKVRIVVLEGFEEPRARRVPRPNDCSGVAALFQAFWGR